jgi:steroid delta-isomerase-like uncharacterized protein
MSTDEHKTLLRRYVEAVWDQGNVAALDDFLSPDYQRHVSPAADSLTFEGQKQRLAGFRSAFPDIELTIEDVIAEGDKIAFRSTIRGTHQGAFLGIAPTGARVTVGLVDVVRIEDGRFVEQWGGPDLLDLLRQLGASVSAGENQKQL